MYFIRKSLDVDFAHHVSGHEGACINVHGHTWKFELGLRAETLDNNGFVVDFKDLKHKVLEPIHLLLDHSLALWEHTIEAAKPQLTGLGQVLVATRTGKQSHDRPVGYKALPPDVSLAGARNLILGGIKIASFPFAPTSELLAKWAFVVAEGAFLTPRSKQVPGWLGDRVQVEFASVYETLHPVEAVATFRVD